MKLCVLPGVLVLVLLGSYCTLGSRVVIEKRQTPSDDCYFDTLPSSTISVGPTCPNVVVDHVSRCPIRVCYTGPGTCTTWRLINGNTYAPLYFDASSGTSALFTPTDLESVIVQCIAVADGVSNIYKVHFETVDGATCAAVEPTTCPVVEPSTAQIDEPTATVPVPDPSSTVQETVGDTETSSELTSPQPTPTRTPSSGDTDPSFDEAWQTGVVVAVCIVAFIVIAFLIFFTVCVAKRRKNTRPHQEQLQDRSNGSGGQGIPKERVQDDSPVHNGSPVEESGVESQGTPNHVSLGAGDPTTTVLGLLSQCAVPTEDEPTKQTSVGLEQPPPAFPPTEDHSAPVLDVSPHDSLELPGRTLYLVSADPDDGDVKSSTVVKTCTNESVLNSNHRLAVEIKDVKQPIATLHPLTHASSPSSLRSDTLSEPISLTQTPSLVLPSQSPSLVLPSQSPSLVFPSQSPSSCLSPNSPPTDSTLPPNSPPTDSSLPPNSPPTDSSLPPNSPPTDSSLPPNSPPTDSSLPPNSPPTDSSLPPNSPPTDSSLPPNSPPTDSSLPPNSPPTDSSLPSNAPPTDSAPTKAALADTECDDSGISSDDSEGSGGSGCEDDDQDSDGASGENTSVCPESWTGCDAVLCNEIAPLEEQIVNGNQENGGEENESGGDIVYTTQLKKSRRLSRTHGARSRKDRVGPLKRAGNTVNLTLSNSEWKPFAMNPELLQRDTMLLYASDGINGLGSTVTAVQ